MFGCGGAAGNVIPTGAERAEQERQAKEASNGRTVGGSVGRSVSIQMNGVRGISETAMATPPPLVRILRFQG